MATPQMGSCPECGHSARLGRSVTYVEEQDVPIPGPLEVACSNEGCKHYVDPRRFRLP